MDMNEVLDFGEDAVTDVNSKLKILKFDYSWADAVEEHEKRLEAQKQQEEMERETEDKNNDNNREETVLNFGDKAVTDWKSKLQILKFDYSWAERVEEEEKKITQEANIVGQKMNMETRKSRTTQQIDIFSERRQEEKKRAKRRNKFRKINQEVIKPAEQSNKVADPEIVPVLKQTPLEGKNADNQGIAQKQATPEEMNAVDQGIAQKHVPIQAKNAANQGIAQKQVISEEKNAANQGVAQRQVTPEAKDAADQGIPQKHATPETKNAADQGIAQIYVTPEEKNAANQGVAQKQVTLEEMIVVDLETAEKQSPLDEKKRYVENPGLAEKQVSTEKRKTAVQNNSLKQVISDEENASVLKCYEMHVAINLNISKEKKVEYPESNELSFKQGHLGNKTASKQEAEENKEVSIKKEVIEERRVADPETSGVVRKQETPGNRKITVIQELLNEDKVDRDNGEEDDADDGLFGPRRLFFFGVDYFKNAEKSAW